MGAGYPQAANGLPPKDDFRIPPMPSKNQKLEAMQRAVNDADAEGEDDLPVEQRRPSLHRTPSFREDQESSSSKSKEGPLTNSKGSVIDSGSAFWSSMFSTQPKAKAKSKVR